MSKALEKINQQILPYSYNPEDLLGKGYSSFVYKGRNIDTGNFGFMTDQKVAIKAIQKQQKKNRLHDKMVLNEIQILKELKNEPHIVKLHEVKQTNSHTYIVTEYCNQGTLKRYMEKKKGLSEQQAFSLFKQILTGYQSIYVAGIIHRDIKPANILMKNNEVRIADFGFAIPINQILSEESLIIGSPMYMPYEALKKKIYSFKGDMWALGITFYEMLAGESLFKAKTQKQLIRMINFSSIKKMIANKFSEKIRHILIRMLAFDMNERATYQEIKELVFGPEIASISLLNKKSSDFVQRSKNVKTECSEQSITCEDTKKTLNTLDEERAFEQEQTQVSIQRKPTKQSQNVSKQLKSCEKLMEDVKMKSKQQQQFKVISFQLISQIHFCRFAYKLLLRMKNACPGDITEGFKQNMKGLVLKKLSDIKQLKLIDENIVADFKESKYGKQIQNIVKQYETRYEKQLQSLKSQWTGFKSFQCNIDSQIMHAYNHISQLNTPQLSVDLIIILDYMITLKQLARLIDRENLIDFHKNSKIEKIVQGVPSKNITMEHVKAIKQKLKGIKLI